MIIEYEALLDYTVNFFQQSDVNEGGVENLLCDSSFPSLTQSELSYLQRGFMEEEVKDAIFSMGPLKASGPDGLQPIFFQSQWGMVGKSVLKLVTDCFSNPSLVQQVNEILLVHFPKVDAAERITQYMPISLCNVVYNSITKVITNRLRRVMAKLVFPINAVLYLEGIAPTISLLHTRCSIPCGFLRGMRVGWPLKWTWKKLMIN